MLDKGYLVTFVMPNRLAWLLTGLYLLCPTRNQLLTPTAMIGIQSGGKGFF